MRQPNPHKAPVREANKWLFDYELGGNFHSESYDWVGVWMTRDEAREWFEKTFDHTPQAVLCIGKTRLI